MDIETGTTQGGQQHHRRASSVARNFVQEASIQQHQYLMTRIQHMVMGLLVLFFVVSMLPSSYVLWLVIILLILMLFSRITVVRTSIGRRQNSLDLLTSSIFQHPLYLLATGNNVNVMNLRLTLLDRDFDEQDYDMLLALDRQLSGAVPNPVTDEEIQNLPLHKFKIVEDEKVNGDVACDDASCNKCDADVACDDATCKKCGKCEGGSHEMCSVCLDSFKDKEQVMSLPCLHYFHPHCITPWMKRQGKKATCPICKSSIFERSQTVTFDSQV